MESFGELIIERQQLRIMTDINELVSLMSETQLYFKQQAQRQVNINLTLRNWLFGFYIAEYELNGADRAEYGANLYKEIAVQLAKQGFKQIRERHLYLCRDFCNAYPEILRSVTAKLYVAGFQYMLNLPGEEELREIIVEEQNKIMTRI